MASQSNKNLEDNYQVIAFYKFTSKNKQLQQPSKEDLKSIQISIQKWCISINAMGCIIVAQEGLNGTICFRNHNNDTPNDVIDNVKSQPYFSGIRMNISYSTKQIFHRLKVKIKSEIVTMGVDVDTTDTAKDILCKPSEKVGTYIPPGEQWDKLLEDPNVLVIDTRNVYEVQMGTFENAINPHTQSFRDFPSWLTTQAKKDYNSDNQKIKKPKAVAMFCTGGIRCEKATSYALYHNLFGASTPIYHLEGGILSYLNTVPSNKSKFKGECFVFDQRVSVCHGLESTSLYTQCYACRMPIKIDDETTDDHEKYVFGLSCKYCYEDLTEEQRERFYDRQRQIELASENGRLHIHDPKYVKLKGNGIDSRTDS